MDTLDQLASFLDQDFNVDYWYDLASSDAQSLVGRLTEPEWKALQQSWRSHSLPWQRLLAYVVAWSRSPEAVPILLAMVEGDDDELSLAAADSLRDIADMLDPSALTGKARARLDALAEKSNLQALAVHELYRCLKPTASPAVEPLTKLRLSPDGTLLLHLKCEEWGHGKWVDAPRVTRAATGEVLLDLWETDWDAAWAWRWLGGVVLRLHLRRYSKLAACVVVFDFGAGTFQMGGKSGPRQPLAEFGAALDVAGRGPPRWQSPTPP